MKELRYGRTINGKFTVLETAPDPSWVPEAGSHILLGGMHHVLQYVIYDPVADMANAVVHPYDEPKPTSILDVNDLENELIVFFKNHPSWFAAGVKVSGVAADVTKYIETRHTGKTIILDLESEMKETNRAQRRMMERVDDALRNEPPMIEIFGEADKPADLDGFGTDYFHIARGKARIAALEAMIAQEREVLGQFERGEISFNVEG